MNKKEFIEMNKKNLEVKVESLKSQVKNDLKRLTVAIENFNEPDIITITEWIQNNTSEIQNTQREIEIYNKVLKLM